MASKKKTKSSVRKPGKPASVRRKPKPRPKPIWMQLGPPTWLQNTPPLWLQVTFVRSLGRTVEVEVKPQDGGTASKFALEFSRTKKRLKPYK